MLRPFDIVTVKAWFDDREVAGKRGHIIGEVTADQIAVFFYESERVWCLHPDDVTATGEIDIEARDAPRGPSLRVNSKGEIVG